MIQREVDRFEQKHVQNGTALGELDHPDYSSRYKRLNGLKVGTGNLMGMQSVKYPYRTPLSSISCYDLKFKMKFSTQLTEWGMIC